MVCPVSKRGFLKPCTSLSTIQVQQKYHNYFSWSWWPYQLRPSKARNKPHRRLDNILLMNKYGFDIIRLWEGYIKLLLTFSWLWVSSIRLRKAVNIYFSKLKNYKTKSFIKEGYFSRASLRMQCNIIGKVR